MAGKDKTFHDHFKENMNAMGLPVPEGFFATKNEALAIIAAIAAYIKTFGTDLTVGGLFARWREVIAVGGVAGTAAVAGAGLVLEGTVILAGVSAATYLGACIGSYAIASGEYAADRLFKSSKDYYSLDVADRVCSLHGIPMPDCLFETVNRPFARMRGR